MENRQLDELQSQRDRIIEQIAGLGNFRPGNLYPNYRKCHKSGCHCMQPGAPGHGPYWLLSRKGPQQRQVSHSVPSDALESTERHIRRYEQFKRLVSELVEVSDALCQATIRGRGDEKKNFAEGRSLVESFAIEAAKEIESLCAVELRRASVDFEALETAVKSAAMNFGARALEACVNADRSDRAEGWLRCGCGTWAKRCGDRVKRFVTAVGSVALRRGYYHCDSCGGGFYPKDRRLGLVAGSLSQAVRRMVAFSAAHMSFACARDLLWELAAVRVSAKQVERSAEHTGRRIAADEIERVDVESDTAATKYLAMDGTGVPMRKAETAGRRGKQPDGGAGTREMKLVSVWTAQTLNKKGRPVPDPMSVTHNAAIETAHAADRDREVSPFAQRVQREADRRGFYDAELQVVLGDGARWIWNLCSELFPDAVQIVDIYHAKEKLWDVAKAVYGDGTELTAQWAKDRKTQLRAGDIEALLKVLDGLSGAHPQAKDAAGYFRNNIERMRYGEFRRRELCVSSAVVESGCKNVIGTRLKRGGMHWSVAGANAIVALRCCVLSRRFDDFWYAKAQNQ